MTAQTTSTETHIFWIVPVGDRGFAVYYQPKNPKTGERWQAVRTVTIGATEVGYNSSKPNLYKHRAAARLAMIIQKARLAKNRK